MKLEDVGIIGNCHLAAHVERSGAIVWCCMPRFDSEPVFGRLLDEENGGHFLIGPAEGGLGIQRYVDNSNVLETVFATHEGVFRVVDLAPRFEQAGRVFRPTELVRIIEPIEGTPRVRIECDPRLGWSRERPEVIHGSNHLRYEGYPSPLRLTTDIPLSYLNGQPFAITERRQAVLTWGAPIQEPLAPYCQRQRLETLLYWSRWVKQCNIPPLFQREVIRSALTLKLHCFEDTGAIVASTTTSIPRWPGDTDSPDARYCMLRDAYDALDALRLLGHFEEREGFVAFLLNVACRIGEGEPAIRYSVDGRAQTESVPALLEAWRGFEGHGPVRVGPGGSPRRDPGGFGALVLALAPVFLDERFQSEQSRTTLDLLERLTRRAIESADPKDVLASLLSWAAADRMSKVAVQYVSGRVAEYRTASETLRERIIDRAWRPALGTFVMNGAEGQLDPALLQLAALRLLPPSDRRVSATVMAVEKELARDGWFIRRDGRDPSSRVAWVLQTFTLIETKAILGWREHALGLMEQAVQGLSPLGLVPETYEVADNRRWGNFPWSAGHVALIHAAFAASPGWTDVL